MIEYWILGALFGIVLTPAVSYARGKLTFLRPPVQDYSISFLRHHIVDCKTVSSISSNRYIRRLTGILLHLEWQQ